MTPITEETHVRFPESEHRGQRSCERLAARIRMIRRYIIWRNKHTADERLRKVVARANVA
ncbi:hypothetical protein ABZ897_11410 [Nonomuraea sp. NPDC046802]|uniref:hypothetical protein n=1 Tax=Nonomuraea sp. NPDC046802 TaxID=3154919 RepID=UPI0033E02CBE